ncbi:ester cyclase [Cellulophaga baltica]|uniref:ester cyclase n=1 Tax=Cellulophaga baltica TaxID=76594 RepID=UPI002147D0A7|nr:ester cyclase [Cellulophaga baltica]MCR1026722.1 ester cyclase [Cellulophaga baltica]
MENLKRKGLSNLSKRLIRAGELLVSGKNQEELNSYFDTENFQFHGPGFDADYNGLMSYFQAVQAAFDPLVIKRGIIIEEDNYIACQTFIEGKFVNDFTQSPIGTISPNGEKVVFDLMNIFKFDNQGKLVDEWVRMDNRGFLNQLGVNENK